MGSRFTTDDVRRLAVLARLDLTEDEIVRFADQLSGILAFAAEIQAVETHALTPAAEAADVAPLREDTLRPPLNRDEVLAAAPHADRAEGLFTVPRVFSE